MIPKSNLKFNIKLPIFFITLNQFSQNPPQKFIFHIFTFQNRGIIINSLFLVLIITKNFVSKNTRLQSDTKRIRSSVFIDARCIKSHRKEQEKKKKKRRKENDATRPRQQKVDVFRCDRYSISPSSSLELFSFLSIYPLFPQSSHLCQLFEPTEWLSLSFHPSRQSFLHHFPACPLCLRLLRPNESLNVTVPVIFLSEQQRVYSETEPVFFVQLVLISKCTRPDETSIKRKERNGEKEEEGKKKRKKEGKRETSELYRLVRRAPYCFRVCAHGSARTRHAVHATSFPRRDFSKVGLIDCGLSRRFV